MPIVVGGTNYYIQSLLWESLLDEGTVNTPVAKDHQIKELPNAIQLSTINENTNEQLYEALKIVDPEMANVLHKNQKRKVRRALEVYATTGISQNSQERRYRTKTK